MLFKQGVISSDLCFGKIVCCVVNGLKMVTSWEQDDGGSGRGDGEQ